MSLSKEKITIEFVESDQTWADFVEDVLKFQPSEKEKKDNDLSKEKINLEKDPKTY